MGLLDNLLTAGKAAVEKTLEVAETAKDAAIEAAGDGGTLLKGAAGSVIEKAGEAVDSVRDRIHEVTAPVPPKDGVEETGG